MREWFRKWFTDNGEPAVAPTPELIELRMTTYQLHEIADDLRQTQRLMAATVDRIVQEETAATDGP